MAKFLVNTYFGEEIIEADRYNIVDGILNLQKTNGVVGEQFYPSRFHVEDLENVATFAEAAWKHIIKVNN